jgi:hypothetical protein
MADFEKGDVIEFCDEQFFVIENNGSTGVVNPMGTTYYLRGFHWVFNRSESKFVRKPTKEELERIGLDDSHADRERD